MNTIVTLLLGKRTFSCVLIFFLFPCILTKIQKYGFIIHCLKLKKINITSKKFFNNLLVIVFVRDLSFCFCLFAFLLFSHNFYFLFSQIWEFLKWEKKIQNKFLFFSKKRGNCFCFCHFSYIVSFCECKFLIQISFNVILISFSNEVVVVVFVVEDAIFSLLVFRFA